MMKLCVTRAVLILIPLLGCDSAILAQERRGPTTLENLLQEHAEATPNGTVARPSHGSADPVITAAWDRYDKAIRAASASLLDRIEKDARRTKPSSGANAAGGLEAAQNAYVERGSLPSMLDADLRNARQTAERAYQDAARTLRQQYDAAAKNLRKTSHAEEAEALGQEWDLLQNTIDLAAEAQLDSTWTHSIANGPSAEITLYSNGSINAPDGPDTWSLEGTTLTIRWRNPAAPGGEWVDTCEVSGYAGSYSGTNQLGTRITGVRVP